MWDLWQICSENDRRIGADGINKLKLADFRNLCEIYDLSFDDFEKLIQLENAMYPIIVQRAKEAITEGEDNGGNKN